MVIVFSGYWILFCAVTEVRFNSGVNDGVSSDTVFSVPDCLVELEVSVQ